MKRITSLLLVALLLLGLMAGCAQETAADPADTNQTTADTQTPEDTDTATDADAQTEEPALSGSITLMASQNWIKDIDRELFQKFEDETGVEVKILLTPDNGYETLLGTSLADGSNTVDIFMSGAGSSIVTTGISEVALDLSGEPWVDRLEDWAVDANTVDGKLLGFSTWGVDYEGIVYNKTLFDEKGWEVPTTWDEFMALCDTIVADGIVPLYENINGVWHTQMWAYGLTPALLAENPDMVAYLNESKDNKLADFTSFKAGLEQVHQLLSAKENGLPKYFTNDGQAEDWFGSYPAMQNRECAMLFTYSAYPAELAANGATDTFGMFPVPLLDNQIGVSNGGGISKFINKNSENIEASKALLNFLAEDENLEAYYAARSDLVTASFKDVESVAATTATTEMLERTADTPPVRMNNDVLYWDSEVYKYMQQLAADSITVDDFINNMDAYRATMFDTAG